ncbi:FeoA family protein [Clostridium oceanicum]|uniref:FeoA family protein n=1 Tax=Clostridium oceanicum TaxID=1543 RepID=A0ABP3UN76_9CLOT
MKKITTLNEVKVGCKCKVLGIKSEGLLKQRLLDLGVVPSTIISVLRKSPFGDPTAYFIRETCIALRKEEAKDIIVSLL